MNTVTIGSRASGLAQNQWPVTARLLRSEWTKIRSVRSTIWSLVILVVHVSGLLRLRVTDDGQGGARAAAGGGLSGLADRIRTVEGRMDIDSPRGGPTVVTVELPSQA